jgi:hypothetical protein
MFEFYRQQAEKLRAERGRGTVGLHVSAGRESCRSMECLTRSPRGGLDKSGDDEAALDRLRTFKFAVAF